MLPLFSLSPVCAQRVRPIRISASSRLKRHQILKAAEVLSGIPAWLSRSSCTRLGFVAAITPFVNSAWQLSLLLQLTTFVVHGFMNRGPFVVTDAIKLSTQHVPLSEKTMHQLQTPFAAGEVFDGGFYVNQQRRTTPGGNLTVSLIDRRF